MGKTNSKYRLNNDTLDCEEVKPISTARLWLKRAVLYFMSSVSVFIISIYLITDVFDFKLPRRILVEAKHKEWQSRLDVLERRLNQAKAALDRMEDRDNILYRSVFGMEQIPSEVREAGYGGVDRYSHISDRDYFGNVTSAVVTADRLMKKAYIQSKSFEQVEMFSKNAEEMALCVPAIPPVDYTKVRQASGFGMRIDPINRTLQRKHKGVDLAPKYTHSEGEPIYATGNGVVAFVGYDPNGYGRYITIDHGFGYKTRYAHLHKSLVFEGQRIKRGQQIAEMGNTGKRSTGTHLHYEVIYMNNHVDPVNYYNKDIPPEDYAAMIDSSSEYPMS